MCRGLGASLRYYHQKRWKKCLMWHLYCSNCPSSQPALPPFSRLCVTTPVPHRSCASVACGRIVPGWPKSFGVGRTLLCQTDFETRRASRSTRSSRSSPPSVLNSHATRKQIHDLPLSPLNHTHLTHATGIGTRRKDPPCP